ncbi:MAG: hypothetical protein RLY60_1397, partial [Pseudomonadota bacterium]
MQVLHAFIGMAERFMFSEVIGMSERFMLLDVIGMAARAGMLFAALSLAKTSPHRRPDGCFWYTRNLGVRDCLGGVKQFER